MTDVSAVVVTWNSASVIADCLASLQRELPPARSEIIVIDNASTDETLKIVRSIAPEAIVVANPVNRGLAAANNQGITAARGDALLICNPDVVFGPGSVAHLTAVLEQHERAAWVVPRLFDPGGALLTSAGDLPTLGDALWGRQAARRRAPGTPSGFWWDGWPHDVTRAIGRGHECAYLVGRRAIEDIGLQDERYVLDWEGLDWTERLRRAGWETWLASEAEVVHRGGTSIRQVPFRAVLSQHRGMYYYFSDRRPAAWKPLLAAAFSIRGAGKLAVTALGVPLYAWAHGGRRDRAGSLPDAR